MIWTALAGQKKGKYGVGRIAGLNNQTKTELKRGKIPKKVSLR